MKSRKPILAAVCFIGAVINVISHIADYRRDRKPSGIRLVFATLGVIAGALALMSDALEKRRAEASKLHVDLPLEDIPDDISFEDETPDDVMISFDDCIECQG